MRSLKFHRIRAQNVLCFGNEGIEISFTDYGNIVQVKGLNLDMPASHGTPASNGAGKSSIQELISIGIFGRTVKKPKKNKGGDIINCLASKGEVEVQWDDYRLIRSFSKSKAGSISSKVKLWKSPNRIWDDSSYLDLTTPMLEAEIERSVGLSHHAFCNVVIFDDSNTYSFLEADTPTKRQIVENLLDLDQYREYHKNAKDFLKVFKDKVSSVGNLYSRALDEVSACDRRIVTVKQKEVNWKTTKQRELLDLNDRVKKKQSQLEVSTNGDQLLNWQKSQDRIVFLRDEITDSESKRDKIQAILSTAQEKIDASRSERDELNVVLQDHRMSLSQINKELSEAIKLAGNLADLKEGTSCPFCHGVISRENYGLTLDNSRQKADQCRHALDEKNRAIVADKDKFDKKSQAYSMMMEKIKEAESKVSGFNEKVRQNQLEISNLMKLPKPDGDAVAAVLESEISELKRQFKLKKEEFEGQSPYKEIVDQAEKEKSDHELEKDRLSKELQEHEAELPYYEYWVEAFGDNGIRKFVIDNVTPSLNERVAHWLECLIEGMIDVKFDNTFDETIVRNGNPASYHNMSNGECRRINLATSQSFAYVMMLDSGNCPSLVFLDEITGGAIDRAGVYGVYNMINELAKERQVFVTTHNETLMSLLQGCDTITLKKENDTTTLVS